MAQALKNGGEVHGDGLFITVPDIQIVHGAQRVGDEIVVVVGSGHTTIELAFRPEHARHMADSINALT